MIHKSLMTALFEALYFTGLMTDAILSAWERAWEQSKKWRDLPEPPDEWHIWRLEQKAKDLALAGNPAKARPVAEEAAHLQRDRAGLLARKKNLMEVEERARIAAAMLTRRKLVEVIREAGEAIDKICQANSETAMLSAAFLPKEICDLYAKATPAMKLFVDHQLILSIPEEDRRRTPGVEVHGVLSYVQKKFHNSVRARVGLLIPTEAKAEAAAV